MYVAFALVLLLMFSAFPLTAQPTLYVGLFLFFLVWWSTWQTGSLFEFGNELYNKGNF